MRGRAQLGRFRPLFSSLERVYNCPVNQQEDPDPYTLPPMPGYRLLPPGELLPTGRPTTRKGRAERKGLPPGRRSRYSDELARRILNLRREGLGVKEIVASGLCTFKELRYWRKKYDFERRWQSAYRSWVLNRLKIAVLTLGQGEYTAWRQMIVKRWKRLPPSPRRVVIQAIGR
jgi:hypothetical protein